MNLTKAELIEYMDNFSGRKPDGKQVTVQFNPDSLKVSFANQIEKRSGPGSQKGNAGSLHVGSRTTKLTLQLWFDSTRAEDAQEKSGDVRKLTERVLYFIRPKPPEDQPDQTLVPPAVQFRWGTFHFNGVVESVEETLEYWSHDGMPLRASISLSLSQQDIQTFSGSAQAKGNGRKLAGLVAQPGSPTAGRAAGTAALKAAQSGATLQSLADNAGSTDWQTIATANQIENPRQLQAGQLLNLYPTRRSSSA